MFNKYHYYKQGSDFFVYEAKNLDNGVQMSLFKNEELIDSQTGMLGKFELVGENIKLKIKNSALKSTHEFFHNGASVELQKIKLKDLRQELSKANVFNAINPTAEQIEAGKFDPKSLLIPVVLMVVGFIAQYFVKDMGRPNTLLPVIPEAIAGWMLYDILAARSNFLKGIRKGRIGMIAFVVIVLGVLGEFLFKFI